MCSAVPNRLGALVRRRRGQRGLSLREAARRIGISPSYLVALEQGRNPTTGRAPVPSPLILSAIGDVLEIDINALMELCGAPPSHSVHLLLYQTGSAHRSPAAAARQVFAARVDTWIEITESRGLPEPPHTIGALRDVLARASVPEAACLGMIFGASSSLLRSVEDPSALLGSETTWEADVAAASQSTLGVVPAANVCVYREADLRALSGEVDHLEAAISLVRTHPHVAAEDGRGAVVTGPAAVETILAAARPAGVRARTWEALVSAAAGGITRKA